VGIEAGGAGRPGGVDVGPQNHFLGRRSAARTSHSRVGGKLSEVELSLWRKVIAPRQQERSQHCGAGRLVGVDPAAQNHFWGFDRAARTSHSRMRVRSFELETSSWRKVIAVRRQERCERSCQRPELQRWRARMAGCNVRDVPGWREIEQEMTKERLIVARRHIDVDHRLRAGGLVCEGGQACVRACRG